jgi:hypothetical protein
MAIPQFPEIMPGIAKKAKKTKNPRPQFFLILFF